MLSTATGENKPTQLLGGWISLLLQKKIRRSKNETNVFGSLEIKVTP
jgi:hypothetical protein